MPNFVENVPLSFVWFYDGQNCPPKLCTKFEVNTFSHCIHIKRKTPNFGSSLSPRPRPFFLLGGILWRALAKHTVPTYLPILKSLPSVVAKILKGNHKFRVAHLAHAHANFFSWQTQAAYQIWSRYRDIVITIFLIVILNIILARTYTYTLQQRATLSTKRSYVLCALPSVTWRLKGHSHTSAVTYALYTVWLIKMFDRHKGPPSNFVIKLGRHRNKALCYILVKTAWS